MYHHPSHKQIAASAKQENNTLAAKTLGNTLLMQRRASEQSINQTGLPDNLKTGMESLSGFNLDNVRVHRNSAKPAVVNAHAYAQGFDIHLAPGQESHLPHELGHVVQQLQGRVPVTTSVNGKPVNNNPALEHEADIMGARALQLQAMPCVELENRPATLLPSVQAPGDIMQLGGHEDVLVANKEKVKKRVEATEAKEYKRIWTDVQQKYPGIFAHVYDVIDDPYMDKTNEKIVEELDGNDYKPLSKHFTRSILRDSVKVGLKEFVKKGRGDEGKKKPNESHIEIENLLSEGITGLHDYKIGTFTADKDELIKNGHKDEKGAIDKVKRSNKMDIDSGSFKYGIRDEDDYKGLSSKGKAFLLPGKRNVSSIDKTIKYRGHEYLSPAIIDLYNIYEYIRQSPVVYVASSLIHAESNDLSKEKVRLVDLAHPICQGENNFDKAKQGMLLGIANLMAKLLNEKAGKNKQEVNTEYLGKVKKIQASPNNEAAFSTIVEKVRRALILKQLKMEYLFFIPYKYIANKIMQKIIALHMQAD